jgi:hypothetical protein
MTAKEVAVTTCDEPALGWTVVLRRQPARILEGHVQGGYTICCACGDHPGLDYRDVSLELQRIRGPYSFAAGITAYVEHVKLYDGPGLARRPGRLVHGADGGSAGGKGGHD